MKFYHKRWCPNKLRTIKITQVNKFINFTYHLKLKLLKLKLQFPFNPYFLYTGAEGTVPPIGPPLPTCDIETETFLVSRHIVNL